MIIVMIIAYSRHDLALTAGLLFLCTKRLTWPEDFLFPSEKKALRPMPGGALAPSSTSPALLTINLLIVRVVIQQLLLRPKVPRRTARIDCRCRRSARACRRACLPTGLSTKLWGTDYDL